MAKAALQGNGRKPAYLGKPCQAGVFVAGFGLRDRRLFPDHMKNFLGETLLRFDQAGESQFLLLSQKKQPVLVRTEVPVRQFPEQRNAFITIMTPHYYALASY